MDIQKHVLVRGFLGFWSYWHWPDALKMSCFSKGSIFFILASFGKCESIDLTHSTKHKSSWRGIISKHFTGACAFAELIYCLFILYSLYWCSHYRQLSGRMGEACSLIQCWTKLAFPFYLPHSSIEKKGGRFLFISLDKGKFQVWEAGLLTYKQDDRGRIPLPLPNAWKESIKALYPSAIWFLHRPLVLKVIF